MLFIILYSYGWCFNNTRLQLCSSQPHQQQQFSSFFFSAGEAWLLVLLRCVCLPCSRATGRYVGAERRAEIGWSTEGRKMIGPKWWQQNRVWQSDKRERKKIDHQAKRPRIRTQEWIQIFLIEHPSLIFRFADFYFLATTATDCSSVQDGVGSSTVTLTCTTGRRWMDASRSRSCKKYQLLHRFWHHKDVSR